MGKVLALILAAALLLAVGFGTAISKRGGNKGAQTPAPASPAPADDPAQVLAKGAQAAVIEELKSMLKDPYTAQITIRDIREMPDLAGAGHYVCGRVNAKNSYGGYVGERDFYGETILVVSKRARQTYVTLLRDDDLKCLGDVPEFDQAECKLNSRVNSWKEHCGD